MHTHGTKTPDICTLYMEYSMCRLLWFEPCKRYEKAACTVEFALIPQRTVKQIKEDSDIDSDSETVEEKQPLKLRKMRSVLVVVD